MKKTRRDTMLEAQEEAIRRGPDTAPQVKQHEESLLPEAVRTVRERLPGYLQGGGK